MSENLKDAVGRGILLPDLCLVEHLEAALHKSRGAVRKLLRAGKIPGARKIGKTWVVSRVEFLRSFSPSDPWTLMQGGGR